MHPLESMDKKDTGTVLRVIRNALAHGNVVYLDGNGHETPGHKVLFLGFLSKNRQSHRVVIFGEEDFLRFLKAWINWVTTLPAEREFIFAETT